MDLPRFTNIRGHQMIKTIIKAMYSAFISLVLISIILAGWTGYAFIFQPSKSTQIIKVIQDIYVNQKSVFVDIIDLSKILKKDTSESVVIENINFSGETKLLTGLEDNSQLDESQISEDNGDNPLGIVIEPSLPELSENTLPKIVEEPFVNDKNELSRNEMEMNT